MDKKMIFGILGILLVATLVIAPLTITQNEDKTFNRTIITNEDIITLEEKNLTASLSFSDDIVGDKVVRTITGYQFIKEVEVETFVEVCVLWNVTLIEDDNIIFINTTSLGEYDGIHMGEECINKPRINKTDAEINFELDILYNKEFHNFAEITRERESRIIQEPIREGEIGVGGR